MIAKCVALLAVVAQINAYGCNSNCGSGYGTVAVAAPSAVVGGSVAGSSAAAARNVVAKGRYPVALDNAGPVPDGRVPITTSASTAPTQVKPLVRLPARIPAPRVVSHSCTCYKSILRPRVHQHVVTVPTVQRYLETTHTPVVENIHYEAVPVNCPDTANSGAALQGQYASSSAFQVAPVASAVEVSPVVSSFQVAPVASGSCSSGSSSVQGYYY